MQDFMVGAKVWGLLNRGRGTGLHQVETRSAWPERYETTVAHTKSIVKSLKQSVSTSLKSHTKSYDTKKKRTYGRVKNYQFESSNALKKTKMLRYIKTLLANT